MATWEYEKHNCEFMRQIYESVSTVSFLGSKLNIYVHKKFILHFIFIYLLNIYICVKLPNDL